MKVEWSRTYPFLVRHVDAEHPVAVQRKKKEGLRDPLKGKDTPPLKHFVGFFFEQWWKAEITVGKHIAFSP